MQIYKLQIATVPLLLKFAEFKIVNLAKIRNHFSALISALKISNSLAALCIIHPK